MHTVVTLYVEQFRVVNFVKELPGQLPNLMYNNFFRQLIVFKIQVSRRPLVQMILYEN